MKNIREISVSGCETLGDIISLVSSIVRMLDLINNTFAHYNNHHSIVKEKKEREKEKKTPRHNHKAKPQSIMMITNALD